MAHFAKLGSDNIVLEVHGLSNEVLLVDGVEIEARGANFLHKLHKTDYTWKQTSYNTSRGVHKFGKTPIRKNYAGIGYTYDESRDAFIKPKPFPSWVLNEETCDWESPVVYPADGGETKPYFWDEDTTSWKPITPETHPHLLWDQFPG